MGPQDMFGLPENLEVEVNRGDKIPSRKLLIVGIKGQLKKINES